MQAKPVKQAYFGTSTTGRRLQQGPPGTVPEDQDIAIAEPDAAMSPMSAPGTVTFLRSWLSENSAGSLLVTHARSLAICIGVKSCLCKGSCCRRHGRTQVPGAAPAGSPAQAAQACPPAGGR